MKNKLFLIIAMTAAVFAGCEKKHVADAKDVILSFKYREVYAERNKVEIRSTSTPSYVADDLWYYFNNEYATMIGDGYRYFDIDADTIKVSVWYKPGVEPDYNGIRAARDFEIYITGVADSVWHAATPIQQ